LLNFRASAAVDGGGNQVYTGNITYKKKILWFIPVSITITNRAFNAPSGIYPYETFPGDYYPLPTNSSFGDSGWFGKYAITLNIAPSIGFIPTPSVLDIGKGSVTLSESDYTVPYTQLSPPVAPKNTPFANFITAYSTHPNTNQQHISYDARIGNWLGNELNAAPTIADCTALCLINTITGDAYNCNNLKPYSVPYYSNLVYHWTVSSNLQITSGQNTSAVQIQPAVNTNGQQGTISVSMTSGDCGTQVITKTISIGIEPLVVTSVVDRTPQSSHYQYLTATATQLAGTTGSNYNWYLEVNNQPTTLIGTGLQLNHYPMAPCSPTTFYRCQVTTACGLSIYRGYAYNTYCSGTGSSSFSSESVTAYPNPSDNSMTIVNNNISTGQNVASGAANTSMLTAQKYSVTLFDNKSRVLVSSQNKNGDAAITISTSNIPNGIYFLHIKQGSTTIKKEVIVKH
jgi:hypothetical protein